MPELILDAVLPFCVRADEGAPLEQGTVPAEFRWADDTANIVTLVIDPTDAVTWPIPIDHLIDGLFRPTGHGDITVIPDPWQERVVEIILSNPDDGRRAALAVDAMDLHDYLMTIADLIETGEIETGADAV